MGKITVLYNNIEGDKRLKTGWGLSILMEHNKELILYDTGPDVEDLFFNMNILGVDIKKINKIVISHPHRDHMGALQAVLREAPKNTRVYLPGSVKNKEEIADKIYVYEAVGVVCRENVLVIDSRRGLIIVTGCAHPGIYRICRSVKNNFRKDIYAALGGFHFEYYPSVFVRILGNLLRRMGIEVIGPNHCTGERAIKALRGIFKEGFVDFGCGRTFEY